MPYHSILLIMALFDTEAENYDSFFATTLGKTVFWAENRLIMRMLEPKDGLEILDVGCGTGVFTESFVKAGLKVTGIDESEKMLDKASKKTILSGVQFIKCDISEFPFKTGSFTRVISTFVIEFLEKPKKVIDEMFRVLKPGGVLVIATLNSKGSWVLTRSGMGIYDKAHFRTSDELLSLIPYKGIAKTCVHFPPNARFFLKQRELCGEFLGKDDGAVIVGRWVR